jgi:hypothetical protein
MYCIEMEPKRTQFKTTETKEIELRWRIDVKIVREHVTKQRYQEDVRMTGSELQEKGKIKKHMRPGGT